MGVLLIGIESFWAFLIRFIGPDFGALESILTGSTGVVGLFCDIDVIEDFLTTGVVGFGADGDETGVGFVVVVFTGAAGWFC